MSAAHTFARPYLERLAQHDSTRLVLIGEYGYTPRKILRRILDHALDHLNQIQQWLEWQRDGTVPIPTDGWATSAMTLDEDVLPLSQADLDAWLWRIDLAVRMLGERAAELSIDELDWRPPDGGWSLRQMLHHAASAEEFYAVWMEEGLPEEPGERYAAANRRLIDAIQRVVRIEGSEGMGVIDGENGERDAEEILEEVLHEEQRLIEVPPL
jgi:DinB superfamily